MVPHDATSPLDAWLCQIGTEIRNRLGLAYGKRLEITFETEIGMLSPWPRWSRRSSGWLAVCAQGNTDRPLVFLNGPMLGLSREVIPTDPSLVARVFGVVAHELLHAVRGPAVRRSHGREFRERCNLAARVLHLPPIGIWSRPTRWPAVRVPIHPKKKTKESRRA